MKEDVQILLEDYKRRLLTIKKEIEDNHGKMKTQRMMAKASCFRTIITELERILK